MTYVSLLLAAVSTLCLGTSCRVRDTTHERAPASARSVVNAPPSAPRSVAKDPVEVDFGAGRARFFVPARAPASSGLPLLIVLHGLGGTGRAIADDLRLDAFASEKGFVYVAPDGDVDPAGRRFWNAGRTCCNFFGAGVDDVARLHALIEHAVKSLRVDARRVALVGYSNGGFMAHRVACEKSESVAAVVSIAAAGPEQGCRPRSDVAVLEIHGDRDPIVPFAGGHLFARPELPRVPELRASLAPWLERNGCSGELSRIEKIDLVGDIAGPETDVLRPSQCAAAPVELWAVRGGSHYLSLGEPAREKLWTFIERRAFARGAD